MRSHLGLVAALASALALASAGTAQAAFPGANGKISFVRGGTVTNDIWTMNPDGSSQAKLTNTGGWYDSAKWSPEGGRLLTWKNDIYVVNAADASETHVTSGFYPAWLPDGQRIGFWDGTLLTVNADGTGRRPLAGSPCCVVHPAWSPDGRKIAFEQEYIAPDGETINTAIYVMNSDATGVTRLTFDDDHNGYQFDADPDWSPDGTKIAFGRETGVNVINAGGGVPLPIAPGGGGPVWSPDGQKIAFVRAFAGIWVMNADGTAQIPLTSDSTDLNPSWQPLPGSSPAPPYETPKLASPIRMALIPVFRQCGSGGNPVTGSHSPPLSVGSCPPQTSGVAHFGPQSKGTAWVATIYGDTNAANGDQADMTLRFDLSDIRTGAGGDYDPSPNADGTLVTRLRFTDRTNGGSGTDPGTATDFDFSVPFNCTTTPDPSLGSDCRLDTSADAVNPGIIKENKATVLQVFRLRLNDSGANGVRGDGDDRLFATEGVFVP
jgi:dipeptidyl aminopeptidase/acylaminoacyl peptidase